MSAKYCERGGRIEHGVVVDRRTKNDDIVKMWDRLSIVAKREHRSLIAQVRFIVSEWLKTHDQEPPQ